MKTNAIIVAAGSSRRMGFDKLAAPLAGKAVLYHSIHAFHQCPEIEKIVVVTNPEKFEEIADYGFGEHVSAVQGGSERHLSVANGLAGLAALATSEADFIAVHDGARPLITSRAISLAIAAAAEKNAVSLAHPVADTLKRAEGNRVSASVSRDNLWAMETPQVFSSELLREAYLSVLDSGETVTDEVSAIQHLGHDIFLVENPDPNPKITLPSDLVLAEAILSTRTDS